MMFQEPCSFMSRQQPHLNFFFSFLFTMRQLSKKCQAATEYLMIIGFVFLILTPVIYLVYGYSRDYGRDIAVAQSFDLGNKLVDAAESLYYFGEPSRLTLDVNMPSGITEMVIVRNHADCTKCTELRFIIQDASPVVVSTFVELNVNDSDAIVTRRAVDIFNFSRRSFAPGRRGFQLSAAGNRVEIRTAGAGVS